MLDVRESVVTAKQWHKANKAYNKALVNAQQALDAMEDCDPSIAYDLRSAVDALKEECNDLKNMSPVEIVKEDFDLCAKAVKKAIKKDFNETFVERMVRGADGNRYRLIAEYEDGYGLDVWIEDYDGKGHHILDGIEKFCEKSEAYWALADNA